MKLKYAFTPDERRVIAQAHAKFLAVVQVILDLHPELKGNLSLAPDMSGILEPDQPGAAS